MSSEAMKVPGEATKGYKRDKEYWAVAGKKVSSKLSVQVSLSSVGLYLNISTLFSLSILSKDIPLWIGTLF